jgi:hypothetical protein
VTSDLGGEQHLGVAAHLVDLDVCKRKKLLDGITPPDNDLSLKIHHTDWARAEFGYQMSLSLGTTEISPISMFANVGATIDCGVQPCRGTGSPLMPGSARR